MSSVQHLREFIRERLSAAAEEIFTQVEKTIIQYEEELHRQRRQLETSWKPRTQLNRTDDVPHQHVSGDDKALVDDQTSTSSLNQEEPESLHIKEEQEDVAFQKEEQLVLKQETDIFSLPDPENNYCSDPEPNRDDTPLYTCPGDEYLEESQHEDLAPTIYSGLNEDDASLGHSDENIENPLLLESHDETELTAVKLHICYTCNKTFSNLSSLQKHHAIHTGSKPYACRSCAAQFSRKDVLMRHMRSHPGEDVYSCRTCGKDFAKHCVLLQHMKIHADEKLFSCQTCGKCFSRNSNLLRHTRTHSGEKPFLCGTCGKCFGRNSHLLRHIRTHRGHVFM